MELSAELLESTVESVTGDRGQGEAERRVNPRVGLRCRTKISIYENGVLQPPLAVWTRDISKEGIGIMSSRHLKVGTRFVIRLPRKHGEDSLLLCTTRNCADLADGIYAIGASFARAISASAKPSSGAKPQAGAPNADDEEVNRIRRAIVS